MILTFQLKYNTVKRRTMIFPLGLCYSANNMFLCNPLLQRFNSWLADKSDKGTLFLKKKRVKSFEFRSEKLPSRLGSR
jgi:hypothetical protein